VRPVLQGLAEAFPQAAVVAAAGFVAEIESTAGGPAAAAAETAGAVAEIAQSKLSSLLVGLQLELVEL
jgi:hypothetical protein